MSLSVCVDAVFGGMDTVEAMRRVSAAGFGAFEFWSWWDKDVEAIARERERLGLEVALVCTRFTSLVDPGQHGSWLDGLRDSLPVAQRLGCRRLVTQSGADTGQPRAVQRDHMVACLRRAAPMLEGAGVDLLLEPLNGRHDHPGVFLESSGEAAEAVEAVGSPRVRMLFDLYHQQISEGDLLDRLGACWPLVGHFHCAGVPGRHELDGGELDYPGLFAAIRGLGYRGRFGLEYFPRRPAGEGLAWALGACRGLAPASLA